MKHIFLILSLSIFCSNLDLFANDPLRTGFNNPPPSAKARTWWHWMNGNVTREGITADLEAMKNVEIQEAQIFSANLGKPQGPATYLSETWLDLFQFAAQEAQRLEMELAFHNGPGWSSSGGPWITPEYAMQTLVYSEVLFEGGKVFDEILPQPEIKLNYYKDIAVLAFPKPKSSERINNLDIKTLNGRIRNHVAPDDKKVPETAIVNQKDIIDLTEKFSADGNLQWNAPVGEWIILRIGHTPTGAKNKQAAHGGVGLECDKMSEKAVDVFWQGGIHPILEKLDTLVGTVLTNCLIDSYEVGTTNWTQGFDNEFKRLRGYDCFGFLPALAGYYVESGEISERFLWDFRRTIGDLIAENYYAYFREKCHKHKMKFSVEPYWGPFDNMQVGATGDIVMCEFWSGELSFFDSPKFVASIAKLNGSSIVAAESFTDRGGWIQHPVTLKFNGDKAWAQGVNRFIFHTYVHQPWNVAPGLALGPFGINFNRLNTWWEQGKAFQEYIARGQFLLQQGVSYADVLVFTGEASPNDGLLMPEIKAMGYDYDLIGTNKLDVLSIKDGLICTPHGAKYQTLVLPESKWLTPKTLQVLKQLAKNGAKIIGAKPQKSPSLQGFPECDKEVTQFTKELWDSGLIEDNSVLDFLKNKNLSPDFSIEKGSRDGIDFIHRKAESADIYFVVNSKQESREEHCRFRVSGKQPELWNAESGEIINASVWKDNGDGTTSIPIHFESLESVFVVFRKPVSSSGHITSATMKLQKPEAIPIPNLEIIKAEYGTFLPDGLMDVTEIIANKVSNNSLHVKANKNSLGVGDPASGYIKELRVQYKIGETILKKNAMEHEILTINSNEESELKILKAVFGKFESGVKGIPPGNPVYDVSEKVKTMVASGMLEIPVDDSFLGKNPQIKTAKALRLTYSTNGEKKTTKVNGGGKVQLTQNLVEPKLLSANGKAYWLTPYPGELSYTTSDGKAKTIEVKSVPNPIELGGEWNVEFPSSENLSTNTTFNQLFSWTESVNDDIGYFSGTASYSKEFKIPKQLLDKGISLELDLGSVYEIAEVFLNDKNLGVLWKSPFRINIDDFVQEETNRLEVKITNLWPNRLIGDEQLPLDFERKGKGIKKYPEWLTNSTQRPTERETFADFNHYNKDSELLPSGLLGPVQIRSLKKVEL